MLTKRRIILLAIMVAVLALAPILAMCSSRNDEDEEDSMRVLTLWQIDSFEGGRGSRAQYLQNVADSLFDGTKIYVNVTALSADAARENIAAGNIPDMLSYGAGFYGIETLVNPADFAWVCWCSGAYVLICLDEDADFSDVTSQNTVINAGKDNLVQACALIEGVSAASVEVSTSAYVSLINGKYKYLLGTQRDLYRMQTRGVSYSAKLIDSFNDLYQNISILCTGENYEYCLSFVNGLVDASENISSLGLISDKTNYSGVMGEMQYAEYEYTIKSFVGYDYVVSINNAIESEDVNSLKKLLK